MAEITFASIRAWFGRAWQWVKDKAAGARLWVHDNLNGTALQARLSKGSTWIVEKLRAAARAGARGMERAGNWRLSSILLYAAIASLVIYSCIITAVFVAVRYFAFQIPQNPPVNRIVYLDQGWGPSVTSELRQRYYYTAQGTSFVNLRYSWFLNLERADSNARFAEPGHMRALGFIVDNVITPDNPGQLPVGFTHHFDAVAKEEFLDFTCAACHTGELHVVTKAGEPVAVRIDGGQAMHAFTSARAGHFGPGMMAAMTATFLNPLKFNRFARNVLGPGYPTGKWNLRVEFGKTLWDTLATAFSDTIHGKYPVDEGFGRTDAIARIANRVFGDDLDPANYVTGNAPVNYPPVWDAPKFDWVQYAGSVSQPLARNLGEALGTGARLTLIDAYDRPMLKDRRFSSSTKIDGLVAIEQTIERLQPPKWPVEILGPIDEAKARKGQALYNVHCAGCHDPCTESVYESAVAMPLRPSSDPIWHVNLIPIEEVGTDPQAALNFYNNRVNLTKTGLTEEELRPLLGDELRTLAMRKAAFATLREMPGLGVTDAMRLAAELQLDIATMRNDPKYKLSEEQEAAIKRELDGINVASTSIGQGLNYLGFLLRKRYFAEHEDGVPKAASHLPAAAEQARNQSGTAPNGPLSAEEKQALYSKSVRETIEGYGALDLPQVKKVYKARPLAGIWATPPFLHNGSVPSLYEMLVPQIQRSSKFFISRANFDPVVVGLVKEPLVSRGFWFDTTIPGNLNTGHEFRAGWGGYGPGSSPSPGVVGPELREDERWALVEYLKVHVDKPAACKYPMWGAAK